MLQFQLDLELFRLLHYSGNGRYQMKVPPRITWSEEGPLESRLQSRGIPALINEKPRSNLFLRNFFIAKLPPQEAQNYRERLERLLHELYAVSIREGLEDERAVTVGVHVLFRETRLSLVKLMRGLTPVR